MKDKEKKSPHISGEHKLDLERSTSDPPIVSKSSPSGTPESTIDADKLLKAWSAMTGVNKELIRVVEKNESDNKHTRRDNVQTRVVVILACVIMVMVTGAYSYLMRETGDILLRESSDLKCQAADSKRALDEVSKDTKSTLKAMRAASEAVGARVVAETTDDPIADEEAAEKGLVAQEEALKAEKKVSNDPREKQEAHRKLARVREHRRAIKIKAGKPEPPKKTPMPVQPTPVVPRDR